MPKGRAPFSDAFIGLVHIKAIVSAIDGLVLVLFIASPSMGLGGHEYDDEDPFKHPLSYLIYEFDSIEYERSLRGVRIITVLKIHDFR